MDFAGFKDQWLGKQVDYDHVFSFQPTDLIRQYVHQLYKVTIPLPGKPLDYWENADTMFMSRFYRMAPGLPQVGDIVVFRGVGTHDIGIATGLYRNTEMEILSQPDGSVISQAIPFDMVTGLIRPYRLPQAYSGVASQPSRQLPHAPVTAPSLSDIFYVRRRIPSYAYSSWARTGIHADGFVDYGKYYVYRRMNGMLNLTKRPGTSGWWINPDDNEEPELVKQPAKPELVEAQAVADALAVPDPISAPVVAETVELEPYRPITWKDAMMNLKQFFIILIGKD